MTLCTALAWRLPLRHVGDFALLGAWLVLVTTGVVLAGIDVQVHRLPRPVIVIAASLIGPLVVVAGSTTNPRLIVRALAAAAGFGGAYLLLALLGAGLVGLGDVYLAALLGLVLGTGVTATMVAAAIAPYLLAAPITALRLALGSVKRKGQIAWGPYLLAGAVLAKLLFPLTAYAA